MKPLPPPPRTSDPAVDRWMNLMYARLKELSEKKPEGGDSGVTDHTKLSNLNSPTHTHLTAAQASALTNGGLTVLHGHPITPSPGDYTNSTALIALAGVTPAADTVPYFTSTTAAAVTGLTAYSRTLLDDANAATWRTTLGLGSVATQGDGDKGDITVSGTGATWTVDNQAITYAKIQNVSATDRLLGRSTSGAGVVEEITCTAAGRAILDDADASAQRTTLGLGTMATESSADFLTKAGNLSGLASAATSRTNLGLGSADTPSFKAVVASAAAVGAAAANAACSFQAVNTSNSAIYSYRNDSGNAGIFEYYNGVSWAEQARFSDTTGFTVAIPLAASTVTATTTVTAGTSVSDSKGELRTIPQNSKSAAYTTVLSDAGKHILHPSSDTTARVFTIDSNANVAYPVGTAITFVNQNSAGTLTISITSDTLRLAGAGTTGSRTLAANGIATALKVASTEWIISGTNLT